MNKYSRLTFALLVILLLLPALSESSSSPAYTLDELFCISLESSEKIKIAEEDVTIAERGRDKALSSLLPKVTAFGNYTKYNDAKFSLLGVITQPDQTMTWGMRLDQTLSLGGSEVITYGISGFAIEKSRHDLDATKEGFLFRVAAEFYGVLKAKKAIEIVQANVQRLVKQRDAAAARLKVGEVTKTDLLRAEAELSGAESDLIRAVNNLQLVKSFLARTAGLTGDFDVTEPVFDSDPVTDHTLDSLKKIAFSKRPDRKSLEVQKRIAGDQVKVARSAYWPTFSLEGVYTRVEEEPPVSSFNDEVIFGGVSLTFPLFEGGLRKAGVGESEAKQRQAELSYEDLKKTIMVDVEDSFLLYMTLKSLLKSLEDQVRFARDNYAFVSRQYEFGLANSIDVIDANALLVTAERQLSDAVYNYQLSIVNLKRSTGILLGSAGGMKPGIPDSKTLQ